MMKKFRWQKAAAGDGPRAEVNMTPLIDVSLVLVVILMLATPLAFESSLGLQRTATAQDDVSEEAPAPSVRLAILSDAEVSVNNTLVAVGELPATLATVLAAAGNRDVAVSCAGSVSHGTFVQVLDVAKLSGAKDIAVTETEPGVKQK